MSRNDLEFDLCSKSSLTYFDDSPWRCTGMCSATVLNRIFAGSKHWKVVYVSSVSPGPKVINTDRLLERNFKLIISMNDKIARISKYYISKETCNSHGLTVLTVYKTRRSCCVGIHIVARSESAELGSQRILHVSSLPVCKLLARTGQRESYRCLDCGSTLISTHTAVLPRNRAVLYPAQPMTCLMML